MIFSLDVRRARKGDCLLLHCGDKDDPGLVMIDGGPSSVYKPHLKPRLDAIREVRGLNKQDSLVVDLLMVSHVDDDHIRGILDLTKEELIAKDAQRPLLLNVLGLWHNSFDEVIGHEPSDLTASMKTHFGAAAASGGALPEDQVDEVLERSREDAGVVTAGLAVLASIEQGFRLRQDAKALGWARNPEVGGKLIKARHGAKAVSIRDGLKFTLVGPMEQELVELHKKHQQWLKDLKKSGKTPPEALAAYVDKSVPNLSSVVVMAESDGKRILFTGDARGDKILDGLQLVGLLGSGKKTKLEIDVFKVPHHGSANNLDHDLFERVVAEHYVFSGNGEHGNPERESLEMLLDARGDADYTVHLTYPIDEIDALRKKDWEKERAKEKKKKETNPDKEVRSNWSPEKHSLKAFFNKNKALAKKVRIVADSDQPHAIDLLEPLE